LPNGIGISIVRALRQDPVSDETDTDLKPGEDATAGEGSLADGMRIIGEFVHTLPRKPGVYRMIAGDGEVLYVGKARSLRSRVAAYTQPTRLDNRLIRMVSGTRTMEFAVTGSEAEALLLREQSHQALQATFSTCCCATTSRSPTSFIRRDTEWPQLAKHRGVRDPATSISAPSPRPPRSTARSTPCSAPFPCAPAPTACSRRARGPACSSRSSVARRPASAASTGRVRRHRRRGARLLGGATARFSRRCHSAWNRPRAIWRSSARRCWRDRIRALAHIQSHQAIALPSIDEADIFAVHTEGGRSV